jgi:ribose 5-phosphate isomerase B
MFGKIFIANDHGGYAAKLKLLSYLRERGADAENLGCDSEDVVRYPYYAARVAEKVLDTPGSGGILICSTGIGMSMMANKIRGIRASLCTSAYMARMTRRHNDSNVLCLGGRITGEYEIQDIVDNWLDNAFEGGRHSISLELILKAEEELMTGGRCFLLSVEQQDEL